MNLDFSKIIANAADTAKKQIDIPSQAENRPQRTPVDIEVKVLDIEETKPAAPFVIPAKLAKELSANSADSTDQSPFVVEDDQIGENNCHHLCTFDGCRKWWSHGPKNKCRFPDIVNQGLCPNCLNDETNNFGEDFKEDGKGGVTLLPARIVQVKNATRQTCANMTIEQLSAHILYNMKRIAELQAESMETSKMRAEREEQALMDIPEEEREKFRQALRRGSGDKEKKTRTSRKSTEPKKESPKVREAALITELSKRMPLQQAKLVAGMMVKTGKSEDDVMRWLND